MKWSLMVCMICALCTVTVQAQIEDELEQEVGEMEVEESTEGAEDIETDNPDQYERWRSGEEDFSPRPKDSWEVGIHAGHYMVNGDVDTRIFGGFGGGLHVRKAISYMLSLRLDLRYSQYTAWDGGLTPLSSLQNEEIYTQDINGSKAALDAYDSDNDGGVGFVRNIKSTSYGGSLQGLFNFGNLLFHAEQPDWGLYALGGVGLYSYKTSFNLKDENDEPYAFPAVNEGNSASENRKEVKSVLDSDYETDGAYELNGSEDEKKLYPSFHLGLGVSRRINSRINISLEHQVILSSNDLLDGYEYTRAGNRSRGNDVMNYTSVRLNINLGDQSKRSEPLYWTNPYARVLKDIGELKRRPKYDPTDSDGDGVRDEFDQEPDTPEGAPVDSKGRALDSDKDGIIDRDDPEPFSPPGFPIDEEGVAIVPDYVTDEDMEQIMEDYEKKIDEKIDAIPKHKWWLPIVHFDIDRYEIKPDAYVSLYQIATILRNNPDVNLTVTGHADATGSEDYNLLLSYNRALASVDYLVENYQIARSRFIVRYKGFEEPVVGDKEESRVDAIKRKIDRRVEFTVTVPEDTTMSRPATPAKAGIGPKLSDE